MPASSTDIKRSATAFRHMSPEEQAIAIAENQHILSDHFDPAFMENLCREIIDLLSMYFRPVFVGFDDLPERVRPAHPLIYASNHSGMAFPWDAIVFGAGVMDMHDFNMKRLFRPLAAPMLSASTLMNPFLLKDIWKRVGAIDASGLNFETLMNQTGSNVLIYPEGVPGIGKGFNRKYQLQRFSTSLVRMSIKYRTDIIWVSCVNGEYINPYSYSSRRLNKLVQLIGIPFLPISILTPLILIQPWLFYYAWPAKLTYVRGKRYRPSEWVGNRSLDEISQEEIVQICQKLQQLAQAEMDEAVATYGKKPFHWREFWQSFRQNWRRLPYWIPPGWPALFSEYDRRYYHDHELPSRITSGWFRFWYIVWKNPIVLAYFIPILGWIPIAWRGLRGRHKAPIWEGNEVKP